MQPRVIREDGFAVQTIGVGPLHGVDDVCVAIVRADPHAWLDRLRKRSPAHDHLARRIFAPRQMNLLGRAIRMRRLSERRTGHHIRGGRESRCTRELQKSAARCNRCAVLLVLRDHGRMFPDGDEMRSVRETLWRVV
jgi:hypothetical protein